MDDESDEPPRPRQPLAGRRSRPWWRPSSRWGQALAAFCALILLVCALLGGLWMKIHLYRDARFRIEGVKNIETTGLTEVSRADLLPVFGEDVGRNIFFVPLATRRRQLEQLPWIEHATVMRLLPDRIRIAVVERKPVAFVLEGGKVGLIDGDGVLLSMPAETLAHHHYQFPVVTGIDPHEQAQVRKGQMAVFQKLMAELDSSSRRLSEQISEIDLSNTDNVRIVPDKDSDIVADFGFDHFRDRFETYKQYIATWQRAYPNLASVDLRYKDRVYLKMNKDAAGLVQVVESSPAQLPPSTPAIAHGTLIKAAVSKPLPAASKPLPAGIVQPAGNPQPAAKINNVSTSSVSPLKATSNHKASKTAANHNKTSKPAPTLLLKTGKSASRNAKKSPEVKHAALTPAKPTVTHPAANWWQEK